MFSTAQSFFVIWTAKEGDYDTKFPYHEEENVKVEHSLENAEEFDALSVHGPNQGDLKYIFLIQTLKYENFTSFKKKKNISFLFLQPV